jgi:hypothetical protein
MPRSAASAVRFDAAWDWTDSASRADELRDLAYYDWSLDDEFAGARPRLHAVADPEVRERPRRRRPVEDWSGDELADDWSPRRRPARSARPERGPRLAPVPVTPAALEPIPPAPEPEPEPIVDAIEPPVIDPQTGRRTITITGRGAERGSISRRPSALPTEHVRHKPDRIAMWAVLLCVLMILAAATSAHAAILH